MGRLLPAALSPAPDYELTTWWSFVNGPPIFYLLATLYGALAVNALVRLLIIQSRLPETWVAQKRFHVLNFLLTGTRSAVFAVCHASLLLKPEILRHLLLDLPSLVFFTAYAALALFWAELYNDANRLPTHGLKPRFYIINAAVYGLPVFLWGLHWRYPAVRLPEALPEMFLAGISLVAALGFLVHGGKLFRLVYSLPVGSVGRRKKLREVGYLTSICFFSFLIRSAMLWSDAFGLVDVLGDHLMSFLYYFLVEILPCGLAFLVMKKLPPKRGLITEYYRQLSDET